MSVMPTIRWSKHTKVLTCPRCKKRFSSAYAKAYHEKNAARLCPQATKDVKHANNQ